jgi:DNA primase large subunit
MGLLVGLSSGSYAAGSNALFGADGEKSGKLSWDMVDGLVKRHAPMCMRSLQEGLNSKHHLKHWGRLQYNLFLKVGHCATRRRQLTVLNSLLLLQELGLPIEEALIFWRRSFSTITDDKFTKEYAYNVKHGYGLVGGRKNYPAKS